MLGGGNTAMDCCRTSRRLGGDDVKVIVRSGFDEMKASPWEKEDAMHEGIPILNFLVPKEFTHDNGRLTGVVFEKVAAHYDDNGRRRLVPTGEPDQSFECDDVLVAIGQENAFPWIERDIGLDFDRWGMPVVDPVTYQSTLPNVFFGGDAAFGPKNIIWAVAHGHEAAISIDRLCNGEDVADRPPPQVTLVSQKMGIHEWSYDNDISLDDAPQGAASRPEDRAGRHQGRGRARLRRAARLRGDPALPQLRRGDGVHRHALHRVRRLRRHLPDGLHHLHRERARDGLAPAADARRPPISSRTSTSRRRSRPAASWPRTRTSACTAACAPSAVRREPGTCSKFLLDMTQAAGDSRNSTDERRRRLPATSRVNDFVVKFANVNGSGSSSANRLFARSILRMGVPVASRNIFPSNIQGLPTWYEVRVSEAGHIGRRGGVDLMVAMNPQTWDKDVAEHRPRRLPVLRIRPSRCRRRSSATTSPCSACR